MKKNILIFVGLICAALFVDARAISYNEIKLLSQMRSLSFRSPSMDIFNPISAADSSKDRPGRQVDDISGPVVDDDDPDLIADLERLEREKEELELMFAELMSFVEEEKEKE